VQLKAKIEPRQLKVKCMKTDDVFDVLCNNNAH